MPKTQPVNPGALLSVDDINSWYRENPWPMGSVDAFAPLEDTDQDTWKTISNASYTLNEAADPLSSGSPVPVSGREGYQSIMGDFPEFGKAKEMTAADMEKFYELQKQFAKTGNAANATKLLKFYGDDLAFVRKSMEAERIYLTYAMLSSACDLGFLTTNSPYLQGITNQQYPVAAWQKNEVGTTWADPTAEILDDIQGVLDAAEDEGRVLTKIKINRTWFRHVRNNTQIQQYTATLVGNLFSTQAPPTVESVNAMLEDYFDHAIAFEVIDERITRRNLDNTVVTSNPFADGVAVFTVATQFARFLWKAIYVDDSTRETYEGFFLVGNYKKVDPSESKIYAKGKGFPVIDSYDDNFYLRINGVAWS